MPSGKPGKFSTSVVMRKLAAGLVPFQNERLQISARSINSCRIPGATGAENDYVMHVVHRRKCWAM